MDSICLDGIYLDGICLSCCFINVGYEIDELPCVKPIEKTPEIVSVKQSERGWLYFIGFIFILGILIIKYN
jgi:hypothetical protein